MTQSDNIALAEAETLMTSGRTGQAIARLRGLIDARPDLLAARRMLVRALEHAGDAAGAELELRAILDLVADPVVATGLANRLLAQGRGEEAATLLRPFAEDPAAATAAEALHLFTAYGLALAAVGRTEASIEAYRRGTQVAPESGVAEHNLAAALGDAHRSAEAEATTRRAFAKGVDASETWLVRGRALVGLREFDEAEAAFLQAIKRQPTNADAHADLAQLIWMRTEDIAAARAGLDQATRAAPANAGLALAKAKLLQYAGDIDGAYETLTLALDHAGEDPRLNVEAALLMTGSEPAVALMHAERAIAVAPKAGPTNAALCQANLAMGRADVAARIAEALCHDWPRDQFPVALAATAWRMLGDPRYRALYDYDRLVVARTLVTPPGWPDLPAFMSDLAARLRALHQLRGHPLGQSLRHGAQTGESLAVSRDPVIVAFFTAIDAPIRAYIEALRGRDDVLARRATSGYRFSGAWSVLLRPGGGYHVDHLHPMGWISSACHIALPDAVEQGREGWLKFGEPGAATDPPLPAEHFVKPRVGDLVLFPSYMWHGTVPFGGETPRLTIAFDVLPA